MTQKERNLSFLREIEAGLDVLRDIVENQPDMTDETLRILVLEFFKSKIKDHNKHKLSIGDIRMITDEQLNNWFTYHAPDDEDIKKYKTIRDYGLTFAKIIRDNTPECADQTVSIRKVREAIMTANASIACKGK